MTGYVVPQAMCLAEEHQALMDSRGLSNTIRTLPREGFQVTNRITRIGA